MRMVSRLSFSAQEVVEEPLNSGRDCGSVWVLDDDDLGGGFPVAHEVRRRDHERSSSERLMNPHGVSLGPDGTLAVAIAPC
jgi:hypothetical protein